MKTFSRSSVLLAVWLSLIAGYIDVLGFLHLGGYFVSFMSGNSTRLAVSLQENNFDAVKILICIILLFVAGSFVGTLIGHTFNAKRKTVILGSIALMLILSATCNEFHLDNISVALLVVAMGAENTIFQKDGDVRVGLTYMTGTLVKIGQKLAMQSLGKESKTWIPYLLLWLGLMTGGVLGAVVYSQTGLQGIWLASAATAVLALASVKEKFDFH